MKYKIFTFGCQMNEDDSKNIDLFLKKKGFKNTEKLNDADLIIINTCTVRQHAEDKALSLIGNLKKWKGNKTEKKIIVCGCAAEKLGEDLKKKFKYIDFVVGAKSYKKIFDIINEEFPNEDNTIDLTYNYGITAYQTISRGCNMNCSYCIVPYVRGKEEPEKFEKIITDIKKKAKNGVKEIILLGQTVNSYRDPDNKKDFVDLLKEISQIDEIKIIRFLSPHPIFFNKKFFDEYSKNNKISRWMHLPLQSGSNKILKEMKRGYTIQRFTEIVNELKKIDPKTSITTDIIVGYSKETEEDFLMTLDAIKKLRFSMAYCFKYSPRFKEKDPLTITIKELEKRHQILLNEVKKIAKELMMNKKGEIEEAIIYDKNTGKTNTGYNCCIIDSRDMKGSFIKFKVEEIKNNILYGRIYE
jgi:tRNA-2-methylthio-N6-dimethylallyladenosine synthase